ncbi:hypothetical protein BH09SUM1_BH09SUM1_08600 [soil metagenome]
MNSRRRDFLRGAATFAATTLLSRALGESMGRDFRSALRISSSSPGPANAKLGAIVSRHALQSFPFPYAAIPGVSRDTNFVHFDRHYCEYFWRWENGERLLLQDAMALAKLTNPAEVEAQRTLLWGRYQETRQASNLVLLHSLYWDAFTPTHDATRRVAARAMAANWFADFDPGGDASDWILLTEKDGLRQTRRIPNAGMQFDPNENVIGAIDAVSHAFLLDFGTDIQSYAVNVLCNMPEANWLLWKSAPYVAASAEPVAPPRIIAQESVTLLSQEVGILSDLHGNHRSSADCDMIASGLAVAAGPDGSVFTGSTLLYPGLTEFILHSPPEAFGLLNCKFRSRISGAEA